MNRYAVIEALREMLDYSPLPQAPEAVQAYEAAAALLDTGADTEELVEALQVVIDNALEPSSHHEYMVREQAEGVLKKARAVA